MLTDRKNQHLDVVLGGRGQHTISTGFEHYGFEHCALPEMHLDDVDLSQAFLGRRLEAPLLVSSMTGGPARAGDINRNLAIACQQLGIALAVGSQRIALESADAAGFGRDLRRNAPDIVILGNLGAAQLNTGYGIDEARRAVEMIGADGLIIHLNPLQEAVQPEGDRDWRGLLGKIEALVHAADFPIVCKEVGSGISGSLARRLADAGVAAIDVAGAGGTNWASVEAERMPDPARAAVARAFAGWGIPTARAIREARASAPQATIIGSGGVRDGVDAAKAIALGANLVGQAAGVLQAAVTSPDAVVAHFATVIAQLKICAFSTGAGTISALSRTRLIDTRAPFG